MTEGKSEAHFAVKLTAFVSMEIMEKLSLIQKQYVHRVLKLNYKTDSYKQVLSKEQLINNLADIGVKDYDQEDFEKL